MTFENELKNGNFVISECKNCDKIIWPPSEFCNQCLKKNLWRECSREGKIIEYSKQNEKYFCVAEIENSIRVMGEIISGLPEVGKNVCITKFGILDNSYFLKMNVLD